MIKVREKVKTPHPNPEQCKDIKDVNWSAFTSSWLSTSAKNIDIREYLGDYLEALPEVTEHTNFSHATFKYMFFLECEKNTLL